MEIGESKLDHGAGRFGGIALAPVLRIQLTADVAFVRSGRLHPNAGVADELAGGWEHDGELIRKSDPVYMEPQGGGLLSAHFYAPAKLFFGAPISTLAANVLPLLVEVVPMSPFVVVRGQPRQSKELTKQQLTENRLAELWSLMHFAARGLLGGLSDFRARYVGPISSGDEAIAAELRARVRPFLLRRTKAQVAIDLPPRTEIVVSVELEPEERTVYDAVRAGAERWSADMKAWANA